MEWEVRGREGGTVRGLSKGMGMGNAVRGKREKRRVMDGWQGRLGGLDEIDGKNPDGGDNK